MCPQCRSLISSKYTYNQLISSREDADDGIFKFDAQMEFHYICGLQVVIQEHKGKYDTFVKQACGSKTAFLNSLK